MIKLPRTLHIEGSRLKVGEVDPDAVEFTKLKGQFLVAEEKVDGSGVSIFFDQNLDLQVWHRGSPATGMEFELLHTWAKKYQNELFELLDLRFILFGEWLYVKHSIFYDNLPNHDHQPVYFLESDIYDQKSNCFLSTSARHGMLSPYKFIHSVPVLKAFQPEKIEDLLDLIKRSEYQTPQWYYHMENRCKVGGYDLSRILYQTDPSDLMEGLYIKHEDDRHVVGRYKYVRHAFLQAILHSGSHYMDRRPFRNLARIA